MEALLERTGSATSTPTIQQPWTAAGESVPDDLIDDSARSLSWLHRCLNFCLALVALVCVLPILLVIALAVKLSSRGPVFYTQERIGLDRRHRTDPNDHRRQHDLGGRPFTIYKFRTMRVDAERECGAVWAQRDDPRVTPVGRLLRQYRLDELPQLLNVVRGEMNIVGPRPERPTIFAELREHIAEYPLRQRAKPGITGLAQISQQYDTSLDDVRSKVQYDLEYIRTRSLRLDLRIMLMTIPVILLRRGGW
ncbi:MAG TPA: sugar transferase [Gemmatimonadales bacterium]|jgi:lipopolysaccharide/colanic/teichoic acid biosynthesis glycosyltransferase